MGTHARTVRQRDVALAAGVSQSTVSLVLHDDPRISGETRARVLAVLDELGYSPDPVARSLRRGRSNLIGVYTYAPVFPVRAEDYFHDFLLGVERGAVLRGNDLVLFASTEAEDGSRRIYGRGENRLQIADGAVILGVEYDAAELRRLAGDGYPFVFIGRREIDGVDVPYVSADYRAAAAGVAQLVHDAGHRRVGYLAGATRRGPLEERIDGFRAAANDLGLVTAERALAVDELDETLLEALLADGVTALVVETADLAERLAVVLEAVDLVSPRDVSTVFLDLGPRRWARASAVGVPREQLGRVAVDLLLRLVDGEDDVASVVLSCTPPEPHTLSTITT